MTLEWCEQLNLEKAEKGTELCSVTEAKGRKRVQKGAFIKSVKTTERLRWMRAWGNQKSLGLQEVGL